MTGAAATHTGRLVRGGATTLAASVVTRAVALAQSIVVARWLEPQQIGVFAIVTYVLGLVAAFADLGLPTAATRLVAEARGAGGRSVRGVILSLGTAALLLATVAGLGLAAIAEPLATMYGEPALAPLFRLAAVLLVVSLVGSLLGGALQGLERIELLAAVAVLKGVAALGGILLLLPRYGLAGILLASLLAELLTWVLVARPLRGAAVASSAGSTAPSWAFARRGIDVALPVFLNGLVGWGSALLVRSWVIAARGYADLGYFQIADALGRIVLLVSSAVAVPLVPMLAEASASVAGRGADVARLALRVTVLVALPASLFLSVAAEPLVSIVYGSAYAPASGLAALLAPAALLQAIGFVLWSTLVGAGRVWPGLLVQGAGQVVLLALAVVTVPVLGLAGLGVAHLGGAAVAVVLALRYATRRLGLAPGRLVGLLAPAGLGWLLAAAAAIAETPPFPTAIVVVLVVVALLWRALTPDEARWLRQRLGR